MSILYFVIILSALLFFNGFFPVNTPNLNVDNNPPSKVKDILLNKQDLYTTNITKTVIFIIDALRLDFVNSRFMPLTSQLMYKNGCFNRIKVEIPTVTLPRIKALTAGNVPQFIDLVLNLASTEVLSDSIIHSAIKEEKKVVFYGDDTWLKLFPKKFMRFEGTNSFFVRDFTEVDDNVTRNVITELKVEDWDIMILHYLGLDHIGHVYGPFSSLIPTKLEEMDKIIAQTVKTVSAKNKDSLFVVTGDHGMRDSGGHGGSTFSETNVPLVLIGPKCENSSFLQTDIPVNLALLLGLKIPSLAIGRVQKTVIKSTTQKYLYALYYNAFLLTQKHSCCKKLFDEANAYYIDYLKSLNESKAYKAMEMYENCLEIISNNLANVSVQQNFYFLSIAFVTMFNCITILLLDFQCIYERKAGIFEYLMLLFVTVPYVVGENLFIFLIMFVVLILVLMKNIYILIPSVRFSKLSNMLKMFMGCSLLHPLTFVSSSYVEEEHQYWYFFNVLIVFFLITKFAKIERFMEVIFCILFLAIFRFLRTMNSTGDKWSNYPDLSDWLLKDENFLPYQIIFCFGLILLFLIQYHLVHFRKTVVNVVNCLTLILIFAFKQTESNVLLGRFIWIFILGNFVLSFKYSKILTWTLVLSLLLKPYNIILIPYCILSSHQFSKYYKKTEIIVLYNIYLSNMLYFAQGHSNSLASVDISVGYIGLTSYQPILVIAQVLCHIQAFPVLCHLLIFKKCTESSKVWKILFCNRLYVFLVTCVVTFVFRHHLFIWSVFSPKLFIEFTHIVFLFLEYLLYNVNIFFSFEFGIYRKLKTQDLFWKSKINKP